MRRCARRQRCSIICISPKASDLSVVRDFKGLLTTQTSLSAMRWKTRRRLRQFRWNVLGGAVSLVVVGLLGGFGLLTGRFEPGRFESPIGIAFGLLGAGGILVAGGVMLISWFQDPYGPRQRV